MKLLGSPLSFDAQTNCSYDLHSGWTCVESLSNDHTAPGSLNWSALGGIAGTIFTPQSGTIQPGDTARVNIFVPNTICPTHFTFSFVGPINTVSVQWRCSGGTLMVSPTRLDGAHNCSSYYIGAGWDCYVQLSNPQDSQGILQWQASSTRPDKTTFNPPHGMLAPGDSVLVTIHISLSEGDCPMTAVFTFSAANAVTVNWSCP